MKINPVSDAGTILHLSETIRFLTDLAVAQEREIFKLNAKIAELEDALVSSGNQQRLYLEELFDLRKRIAELEAAQRWIPVSERLPEDGDFVLGWGTDEIIEVLEFCTEYGDNCFYNIAGDTITVTHWMPLPEPPEVELWNERVKG